ncbi:FO synthase subunit 2 [Geoglobus ahangari]|uniref:5-amino-6-(D-ribitylamino)uracil--L-tyrosine 4-hydroxyphenyl transferase n=1 Tax=Geoglobus ahangari TaxID=113653 RepID=A0A0F7IGJ8_9EURY|nr:5-amino-6-(D-ribitylamino)uracil--L-tyrosine 4-hydroxyphenyl transferase CofH [Geoglobus ahangari]AKG91998.1 FO synthase subunit 2 [Geoglobus ahangari]
MLKSELREMVKNPYRTMEVANRLREELKGDVVTFVVNRNINFTDICVNSCLFCSYSNRKRFFLSEEEIRRKVREAVEYGCTEVTIQGGLFPNAGVEHYVSILKAVRRESKDIHIHAFSPMEVVHASRNDGVDVEDVLREFRKAGLNSMPGTAAEILVDRVRKVICPDKLTTDEWVEVITTAHSLGIPTTATMMYGHVESWEDRMEHLNLIRQIQEETGGFTEFIPLPFMDRNNRLGEMARSPNGFEDLLVIAVARIVLYPLIENIQASWVKMGRKLAQASLFTGANDVGGTLMEENISKSAGATSGEFMTVEELRELILSAGRIPAERDTLYNLRRVYENRS